MPCRVEPPRRHEEMTPRHVSQRRRDVIREKTPRRVATSSRDVKMEMTLRGVAQSRRDVMMKMTPRDVAKGGRDVEEDGAAPGRNEQPRCRDGDDVARRHNRMAPRHVAQRRRDVMER